MASADIQLNEADIPGAYLSELFSSHTVPELRWWLRCRGVVVPTSWKKRRVSFLQTRVSTQYTKSPGIVHAILTALSQPSIGDLPRSNSKTHFDLSSFSQCLLN